MTRYVYKDKSGVFKIDNQYSHFAVGFVNDEYYFGMEQQSTPIDKSGNLQITMEHLPRDPILFDYKIPNFTDDIKIINQEVLESHSYDKHFNFIVLDPTKLQPNHFFTDYYGPFQVVFTIRSLSLIANGFK
jgi:hypothetical protein